MPIYRAVHECGYTNEVFLKADKNSVPLICKRCGRQVIANQVRNPSVQYSQKDEITGVYSDET